MITFINKNFLSFFMETQAHKNHQNFRIASKKDRIKG